MRHWKKRGFEFLTSWVELSFLGVLALGFVAGKLVVDVTFSYLIIASAGLVAGRLSYVKKENDPLPFKAISLAFLVGYLFGHRVGAGIIIVLIFMAVAFASYKAHQHINFLA